MGKTITKLMVLLTALLLTMPVSAQTYARKQAKTASKVKMMKDVKYQPMQSISQMKAKKAAAKAASVNKMKAMAATNGVKGKAVADKAAKAKTMKGKQFKSVQTAGSRRSMESPVSAPYMADFSVSDEAMEDFVVINHNEDLSDFEPCTWKWSYGNGAYYIYNEDGETSADDYLVLPITLEGGKTYDVTVNAASWNYPEEFEVVAGTACTAEAMTTEIVGKTTPQDEPADYAGTFTPTADGVYYIAIHATSAADQYVLSIYRLTIEVAPAPTAPAAVTDFTVVQVPNELKNVITFTAPTVSVAGDQLIDNISVDILRNGEVVKTFADVAPGSERSYTDEITAEGIYSYQVIPSNADGPGRRSGVVSVRVIMPRDVPFVADFTDEDVFSFFKVIDNNDDGSTWNYSSYDEAARYSYSFENDADDYLVTPALRVTAGKKYDVTVHVKGNEFNSERFMVVTGTAPTADGLGTTVIEATEVAIEEDNEYTGSFVAEADGFYYVAVKAISDVSSYYLYVSNLSVEQGAEQTAPAAPVVAATAAAEGALSATIQVTAPTKTVEGNTLTAITKLELYRDGTLTDQKTDVTPGAVVTFTDTGFETFGLYTYQAVAYNESGRGEKSEKETVYVGLDQPLAPETVFAVDHATSVDLSWTESPSVGMNDGYVNPADVTYNVWDIDVSDYFVFFNDKITSVKGKTAVSFNYAVDEGNTQQYKYFAVRPVNDATQDEDQADWNAYGVFAGKPYDTLTEGFADGELHYFWNSDALLAISTSSSDGDDSALALLSDAPGQKVFLSGKLNLKAAARPMLVFDALNANNISTLYIMGSVDQGSWQLLQTVTLSADDYQTYQIPLTALKNHERYAQIAFAADFTIASTEEMLGDYFFLDNIRVGDFLDNDLAVIASAPSASFTAGKTTTIDVQVENIGLQAASNYTVKVTAGEKELLNETATDELASFGKKVFTAEWPTTVFDEAGDVTVTVSVEYAADQNAENNTISADFTILEPTAAAPTNLLAEDKGDNGVDLTWTAPEVVAEAVVEDFEDGPGEFTQIDGNNDGYVWEYLFDDELKSHSGYGGLQSYSWVPGGVGAVHVDNWVVTPRAVLNGTFSFWAAAQDGEWTDEHFAVYVSTTGNKSVDDFTKVSEEFVATGWPQEYTVDLSSYEGQEGYIAIRHFNSYDNFALVVDDISFTKAPALPVKYNIYYEGELIATVEGDVTTYTVAADKIQAGSRNFSVTAVYSNGKESKPITDTVEVTTAIWQIAVDGSPVDIYSLDGKLVRSQAKTLGGLKGVYVVNGRKVMIK